MAKMDLESIGLSGAMPFRVAASATRGYVGEPTIFTGTYSSGVASANTIVVATDATPVIGTDVFVGLLMKDMEVNSAGTVIAHRTTAAVPIARITRIRGRAKTSTTADTESECIGLLWDDYLIDLTTGAYTLDAAGGDTAAFQVAWYDAVKAKLDVVIDSRGFRADIS